MKIYKNITVLDAAIERINWVFDEFSTVICSISGGKDSTVLVELALEVARKKKRLPLKVMFIDQEAEWQATVEQVKYTMYREGIEPKWYQMPIVISNATSVEDHWLKCWEPGVEWMREKDEISIKDNIYNEVRFHGLFSAILKTEYPSEKVAYLAGVTAEESIPRYIGLTNGSKYKWVTWGKTLNKKLSHYTFYPLYDWSYSDVWKAIHDHGWRYNKIYDLMYQYGLPIKRMRVSNLHHETAVHSLFYLQEFEPDTYARLVKRLKGIDCAGKFGKEDYFIFELPFMFTSWKEYRDYLLEKLITNENWVKRFKSMFASLDALPYSEDERVNVYRAQINSILTNDWEGNKLAHFRLLPKNIDMLRKGRYRDEKDNKKTE